MGFTRWINTIRGADGQALVEYALIVSFVAVVCAGTLAALGVGVDALMSGIPGAL